MRKFKKLTAFIAVIITCSLVLGVIPSSGGKLDISASDGNKVINATIDFSINDSDKNISVGVEYSDSYFCTKSTEYNHNLAKASVALSAAAYEVPEYMKENIATSSWRDNNIYRGAEALGFGDIVSHNYDDEYFLKMQNLRSSDSCGFVFAEKQVCLDANDSSAASDVVLVVVRGTANEEWFGNFNVVEPGSGKYDVTEHYSFRKAEQEVKKALEEYLGDKKGKDNLKIWITGHSRGAAVANLLAADITDSGFAPKENIYAYTFATPNGSTLAYGDVSGMGTEYENIWNIVNPEDFVPYLAFTFDGWNFGKWGNTLYLPNKATAENKSEFDGLLGKVLMNFGVLTGERYRTYDNGYLDTYRFILDAHSVGSTVEKAYGTVSGQSVSLVEYFNIVAKLLAWNDPGIAIQVGFDLLVSDTNEVTKVFAQMGTFLAENGLNKKISHSHEPATYIAWMNSIEEDNLTRISPDEHYAELTGENGKDKENSEVDFARTSFGATASKWALAEIEKAMNEGIIPQGFMKDDLREEITREEFAAIAVKYYEKISGRVGALSDNPFEDIESCEYKEEIIKAYNFGITNGTGQGIFAPSALITREQAAVMLARVAEKLGNEIVSSVMVEEAVSEWARNGVGFVMEKGIMNGTGNGFEPFGMYTKEQSVATFIRMFEKVK